MNRLTETMLLARVRQHYDADAFAKLYDAYVKRVYRFVYFKVARPEDAEDITAEVFLKTWNYLRDQEKVVSSFSGLIYRIARTSIVDWYRNAARRKETVVATTDDERLDISDRNAWVDRMSQRHDYERVLTAIRQLKHDYQELVVLRYVEDFSLKEISEITQKNILTVRVTLHRALKKLESILSSSSV